MLVFGDRIEAAAPRQALRNITAALKATEEAPAGVARHDLLTRAFLDAAGLAQAIADAEFEVRGLDDLSPAQDAAMALLLMLARKLTASAWSGYGAIGPGVAPELMDLAMQPLPEPLAIKTPEGFAFYAVYPEAYLKAAAEHPWTATPLVIGLRSIGAGLAALVAAVTGAKTLLTLRPSGPPFQREMRVSSQIRARLAAHDGPFAVVDEGPGLSGSSFGATADLLQSLGVDEDRIVFMPSHRGDLGPHADPQHRARWARAAKPVATFEDLLSEAPLADWFSDLTGPVATVEDISGGQWRAEGRFASAPPPAHLAQERLKFRLHTASGVWLARFAGLGAIGEAKFERAKALHRAGFSPEPLALRRGFLLERWEVGCGVDEVPRARMVEQLGDYLAFRAVAFPAEPHEGASRETLAEMARVNVAEALDPDAAAFLTRALPRLVTGPGGPSVHVDARLHAWEWLRTPDDLILKTDAVDHSAAHDLVGAQDIAWDVAGAKVEFDLTPAEVSQICDAIEEKAGYRPRPPTLLLFDICYPAFQVGYWRMAEAAVPEAEKPRLRAQAERYVRRLAALTA